MEGESNNKKKEIRRNGKMQYRMWYRTDDGGAWKCGTVVRDGGRSNKRPWCGWNRNRQIL